MFQFQIKTILDVRMKYIAHSGCTQTQIYEISVWHQIEEAILHQFIGCSKAKPEREQIIKLKIKSNSFKGNV